MKVLDPGHVYQLQLLDDEDDTGYISFLTFVKREGPGYPGNIGHHPGTTIQEVLRALIDRVKYLHKQQWDQNNPVLLNDLRHAIYMLEERAARKHHRTLTLPPDIDIENLPTCPKCLHIGCEGKCHT